MRILSSNPNVDNSDLVNFPDGRIKDNDGSGNGTGINERTNGDIHQTISRLMRKYGIVPNGLPDNVTNGYQIVEAIQALASKNDFVLALTDVGGVLSVPIKFSFMDENESVVCKSGINLAAQTQIKGSDATTFNTTYVGSFKNNEYVRVIKTASGVTIVRLADAVSLDAMVAELNFLKKATQTEENAGTIDTKATTPLTNLTAFVRRVIGVDSVNYLATAIRNGLYPKEHFTIVDGLSEVIKAKEIITSGWSKDRKFAIAHGIVTYTKILNVSISLKCISAEGGYSIGDIVNVQERGGDQDGSNDYDYGMSAKWTATGSANLNVFIGDRIYLPYGPSDPAVHNNVFNVNASKWDINLLILYI